jgi:2-hydroxychromene-2-carboxylate isomerase
MRAMPDEELAVEVYIDPSCPWAWVTSRWVAEVAPHRGLRVTWPSYCLQIRDDYDVAPTVPPERRDAVIAAHAQSHRMLRIFEAARDRAGEDAVDRLYAAWGRLHFVERAARGDELLAASVAAAGLDADLVDAADDDSWDERLVASMQIAYEFAGVKTQTPAIVVREDPPHGFKGPVMEVAPTGDAAVRMWDAVLELSRHAGFFEIARPRRTMPFGR